MSQKLECRVRALRQAAGLSQGALAETVGLSRQALSALEAGRSIPGTDVALRLARALESPVEALFTLESGPTLLEARPARGTRLRPGARVLLTEVHGAWVARPISERGPEAPLAADAVVVGYRKDKVVTELLADAHTAASRLVVMGCAPALGLLAARLARGRRPLALAWVHGSSGEALDALESNDVHIAGIHLQDARSGHFNTPQVQRRFGGRKMQVVNFAAWEQGLVVAPRNPLKLKTLTDIARPKLRWVGREPGSGASKLIEQALGAHAPKPVLIARGHMDVAQAVAQGAADAGVAIRAAALAWGLDFIPASAERFDLVLPTALAGDPRIERLVDELGSASFRREVESVGGYETHESGQLVS